MSRARYGLLGVWVNALTLQELNDLVARAIADDRKWVIANHNLNSVRLSHRHPGMKRFFENVEFIHVDGMPLVWIGRLLGHPLRREHRVTYVDWLWPLMGLAEKNGWRVFYLGSRHETVSAGVQRIREQHPELGISFRSGYFDSSDSSRENAAVIEAINAFRPHVLMVGMGMPRQEIWIADNLDKVKANVVLPSGAAIDYVAGAVATPPRWSGKIGMEWVFRLAHEPRRLWRRYLVEPWSVSGLLARDLIEKVRSRWG